MEPTGDIKVHLDTITALNYGGSWHQLEAGTHLRLVHTWLGPGANGVSYGGDLWLTYPCMDGHAYIRVSEIAAITIRALEPEGR